MPPLLLADIILIVHAVYVGIVVLGVPLIVIGGLLKWPWVHNPWFRITHLLMIGIVVAESLLGVRCPLTVWEHAARHAVAHAEGETDFVAFWLGRILFHPFSHQTFTMLYIGFGALVVALLFIVPIKRNAAKPHAA